MFVNESIVINFDDWFVDMLNDLIEYLKNTRFDR